MENNKRKLNVLTISDKVRLISLVEKGDRKKCEIAKEFNIQPNTLSSIMKQKDKIVMFDNGNMKKMRMTPYIDIDKCLLKWFAQCRDKNISVSGSILLDKANEFARQLGHTHFKASSGWITNWKKRHNVLFRKICRESALVIDTNKRSNCIKNMPEMLSETIENASKSEDKPQKEEEITAVSIKQAKHALKILKHFFETTTSGKEDGAFPALSNLENIVEDKFLKQ